MVSGSEQASNGALADWGSLPADCLALILRMLTHLVHQQGRPGGLISVREAAQLLAAASPCRHWRAVALAEIRCSVWAGNAASVCRLAAAAIPCRQVQLPQPQTLEGGDQSEEDIEDYEAIWATQLPAVEAAVTELLSSELFRARSSSSLAALLNCPLAVAQSGVLLSYPSLRCLSVRMGRWGQEVSLQDIDLQSCCPPAVQRLQVLAPGCQAVGHLRWPAGLQLCSITAHSTRTRIRLQPCSCGECRATGFWGTCRALHASLAASGVLVLDLSHPAALSSCTRIKLSAQQIEVVVPPRLADNQPAGVAATAPGTTTQRQRLTGLQRCIASLEPAFAACPELQHIEIDACVASLYCPETSCELALEATLMHPQQQPSTASLRGLTAQLAPPTTPIGLHDRRFLLRVDKELTQS